MTKSADSGISTKDVKFENPDINSGHTGNENVGYGVIELLSTFRDAPKPTTSLNRKIEETSTDQDQLINEASQDLVQILSRHFPGMNKVTINEVVEKVAATYRNKTQNSRTQPDCTLGRYSLSE